MLSAVARRRCPELVFIRPSFDAYRAVAAQAHAILARYTPLVQPLSLDEVHLDAAVPPVDRVGPARPPSRRSGRVVCAETDLTCSAEVSYNKVLVKLALA